MTESWVEGFNAALLKFLNSRLHGGRNEPKAVEIISYDQDIGGGCDTCGPSTSVDFYYKCADKGCTKRHHYMYWGSLGYIIEELTS